MMWLPTKIYESLPVFYVTIGALILYCAFYIGVSHGLMPGYTALGLSCMIGGMFVSYIRQKARSQTDTDPSPSDRAAA